MRVVVDEGSGPAVVLLHGQPGTGSAWGEVVGPLRAIGARVIAVDRPGYAGDPTAARGLAANGSALLALLDDLGIPTAVLVGHSWGGGVAIATAAAAPHRVSGLLLVASIGSPLAVDRGDALLARPALGRLAAGAMSLAGTRLALLLAATGGSRLDSRQMPLAQAELARWRQRGAWEAFRIEQRALLAETPSLAAALPGLQCPVIVLQGRRDGYVSAAAGRDLARRIGHARYVETDAGHLLNLEATGLIAELVAQLLGSDRRGPAGT